MVDECITWKDHIDEVAKKAAKGIGILRRSNGFLDKDTLKTIYSVFVLPHFDYCALVWHNCSKALQNKLQNTNILLAFYQELICFCILSVNILKQPRLLNFIKISVITF